MTEDVTVSIVPPTGGDDERASEDDSEPAALLASKDDAGRYVETGSYPELTIHASVQVDGVATTFGPDRFGVVEGGDDARPIESVEFLGSALDLVFVFDDTGSMDEEIAGAKAGVTELTDAIAEQGIDARYGLVTFKDDVEVDTPMTRDADRLKADVDSLWANAGGDVPEANLDAIERALDLDLRDDAETVFVDITDAPTHYRGDGSNYSNYVLDEVAEDLLAEDVTFIAVAPDWHNSQQSIKHLAGEVGGLWTDIEGTRGGTAGEGFQRVLDRITSLLVSTYVITYRSCITPGTTDPVTVEFDHPEFGAGSDTTTAAVPGRFELPAECREADDVTGQPDDLTDGPDDLTDGPDDLAEADPDSVEVPDIDDVYADEDLVTDESTPLLLEPDQRTVPSGDTVKFTVRDLTGDRVPGAVVETPEDAVETGPAGTCHVRMPEVTGTATVEAVVRKDGDYEPDTAEIEVKGS